MPSISERISTCRPQSRQTLSLEPSRVTSPSIRRKSPARLTRKEKHETGVSIPDYVYSMTGYKPGPLIDSPEKEIGAVLSNRL